MTVRQRSKVKRYSAIVAFLVSVITLAQFGIKPVWAMYVQIQANSTRLVKQETEIEGVKAANAHLEAHFDKRLDRLEDKADVRFRRLWDNINDLRKELRHR